MTEHLNTYPSLINYSLWADLSQPETFIGKTGLCDIPIIPMRAEPSDSAEMVAQLCFGDVIKVIGAQDSKIEVLRSANLPDSEGWSSMTGWIDAHFFPAMYDLLKSSDHDRPFANASDISFICDHTTDLKTEAGHLLRLPAGCSIPLSITKKILSDESHELLLKNIGILKPTENNFSKVINAFMGAPYLWGGQTSWGTDCSGFVQSVMRCFGVFLPRDSSQQVGFGDVVDNTDLDNIPKLSLAYYGPISSEKITHVGFLNKISKDQFTLIHAKQIVKAQDLSIHPDNLLMYPESTGKANLKAIRSFDVLNEIVS